MEEVAAFRIYFLSFLLGIAGALVVSQIGDKIGFLDLPNERSSHRTPTPRGGGIGIFAAFLLSAAATDLAMTFWLPISALSILAFYGDRIDLSPKLRLYAQLFLVAFLVIGAGYWPSNPLWYVPWVLFWTVFIVGTANFYNFMDGVNGIAGISGIVGFGLLAVYIFLNDGPNILRIIATCISLSCLGFLPLNMPKAKVFMGDIGSILLGSVFASLVFLASQTFLDFVVMVSFLFPFYADELTTMLVRLRDGETLTQAHRRHIYQILANEKGIPQWKISAGFGFFQLVIGASAILVKPYGIFAVVTLLILCLLTFTSVSFYLRSFLEKPLRTDPTSILKRSFDTILSLYVLIIISPILVIVAWLIKKEDDGPVFYRGERVGRNGKVFHIFKFRTMGVNAEKLGGPSTADDDPRITRIGRELRKHKLDELPQFINVLWGDMSLVGPRPEVKRYTDMYTEEEKVILSVRPGITDWASIWNSDEGSILAGVADPEAVYLELIRPTKIKLQLKYVREMSFFTDLRILWDTMLVLGSSWTRERVLRSYGLQKLPAQVKLPKTERLLK